MKSLVHCIENVFCSYAVMACSGENVISLVVARILMCVGSEASLMLP